MAKQYSKKFWFAFWTLAVLFLGGWYFYWETKNQGFQKISQVMDILPMDQETRAELGTLVDLADRFTTKDGHIFTFLVLFQNNMELRPGGGFLSSFGILKIKDGGVADIQIHDTGNFDGRVPTTVPAPYPMSETLRIKSLQLRDSNYSPDFPTNARAAIEFYELGQGAEKFDGVVAINANVLTSFLKVTGPISLEGYPGTYQDEDAIIALEYQVEKAFDEQGIPRGERKSILNDLARAILGKVSNLSNTQKIDLARIVIDDLRQKDIQLYFPDSNLEAKVSQAGWSGEIDQAWTGDYLMPVDANLGAYKSDYYVERSVAYTVDFSSAKPSALLKITYNHTAKQKDFMTKDYLTYLRVYVPEGAWLASWQGADGPVQYGHEGGKKYFGAIVKVPLGTTKTIELRYDLPENIAQNYNLKIQKQSGLKSVPYTVILSKPGAGIEKFDLAVDQDLTVK